MGHIWKTIMSKSWSKLNFFDFLVIATPPDLMLCSRFCPLPLSFCPLSVCLSVSLSLCPSLSLSICLYLSFCFSLSQEHRHSPVRIRWRHTTRYWKESTKYNFPTSSRDLPKTSLNDYAESTPPNASVRSERAVSCITSTVTVPTMLKLIYVRSPRLNVMELHWKLYFVNSLNFSWCW